MKTYADKGRIERTDEGYWVYLPLQPHRQSTSASRRNLKLAAKYHVPFQIVDKVGPLAYKMQLPFGSKSTIFHISQALSLRRNWTRIQYPISSSHTDAEGQMVVEPMALQNRRMVKRNNCAVDKFQISGLLHHLKKLPGKIGALLSLASLISIHEDKDVKGEVML